MKTALLPLLALLALAQCTKKKDPDPVDQLPPATQTGANTFGCLVNGKAWTPQGNNGFSNNNIYYDSGYRGGSLGIRVYRIENRFTQNMIFGADSIANTRFYPLVKTLESVYFSDSQKPPACQEYDGISSPYCRGALTITRLDRSAGIVSGTFWFTLYKPGCDSIRVTNGRFDRKL